MQMLIKRFKQKNLSKQVKRLTITLVLSCLCLLNLNCGKRKPPQPPIERIPQRVSINGTQIGDQIRLVWQMPARNAKDSSLLNIERAEIFRLAEPLDSPLSLTQEEFASRSTLIASIMIKDTDFALKEQIYIDQLQFAGQAVRLRYSVRFVNSSGQKAAFSNFLVIQPSPRIAQSPSNLIAKISQNAIEIKWIPPENNVDDSTPVNILGYNIYRFDEKKLTRRLNKNPIDQDTYKDEFFTFGKNYNYYVRTVSIGSSGQQVESKSSDILKLKPIDNFPPAAPNAITIAAAPNNISIFFAINLEKDIAGYKIYRSTDPNKPKEEWTLLTKELLKVNTFQDTKVESNVVYYYYIKAIDKFGNESVLSETVNETAL